MYLFLPASLASVDRPGIVSDSSEDTSVGGGGYVPD